MADHSPHLKTNFYRLLNTKLPLGSGNDEKPAPEQVQKKPKQNHIVKENVVSINPSLKESFLKFSVNESFIDKNRIKDNFSGETNGVSRDHVSVAQTLHFTITTLPSFELILRGNSILCFNLFILALF